MRTLELEEDPDLLRRIREMIYRYEQQWSQKPNGLLVGPVEWLQLRYVLNQGRSISDGKLFGLPIIAKRSPGLDVVPHESIIGYYADDILGEKRE